MPDRMVGLDIGRSSIKAVRATLGIKGLRVNEVAVLDIAGHGGVAAALAALFERPAFRGSLCAVALPLGHCSFRTLQFPFRDRKKIRQTIAYEMDQHLPYPIDGAAVDFIVVEAGEQSKVIAAAAPKEAVADFIKVLDECHIEVSVIDINSVPVATALLADGVATGCGLLIDVGMEDTSVAVFDKGAIVHIRHFPFGGVILTGAVARACGIDGIQAEQMKRSGDAGQAADEIAAACRPFFHEVRNMLKFLDLRGELPAPPEGIILTGGGALSPQFREALEKFFSLPVRLADLSTMSGVEFDDEAKAQWDAALLNQALALAAGDRARERSFNFGRGEFEPKGKLEKWRRDFKLLAAAVIVVLLLGGVDFSLDYFYDRARLNEVKGRISAVFAEAAPDITKIVDPVSQLRARIDETRKTGAGGGLLASGMTMLDILADVSRLVPDTVEFYISSFTFDGGFIDVRGETDNFNNVDTIKVSLEKSPYFKSITISSANLIKGESRIGFDLKIELAKR